MAEIRFENVSKSYRSRRKAVTAVAELNYTVEDGEFVTLLGPSGCGKSTTLNMVAGLEDISGGKILIDGVPVNGVAPGKRDLAFVFQDYALYPHMDLYANIAFGLKMRKVDKAQIDERVLGAAERVGIAHLLDRKPKDLSGGQRQRVAVARAIARRPGIFLFDEPLSNLDALLRDQTRSELKRLHQELEPNSLYVTHDQQQAMTLSDLIAVMSDGHLEQIGTPEEIYNAPATEFVAHFVGKPRMNLFTAVAAPPGRYVVEGSDLRFALGDGLPERIRLGIRPEDCVAERVERAEDAGGRVRVVEPVGNASDVVIESGALSVTARIPGFSRLRVGDPVSVTFDETRLHCFEVDSGRRIDR